MKFSDLLYAEGIEVNKDRGEHIFMQGDTDRSLYFIQSGLLKAYYTSEDGKEFVKSFLMPDSIITSLASAYSAGDCSFSLICLEQTSLKKIPFEVIANYSEHDLELANSMVDLLLQFAIKKERREYEFLCLNAEERYCEIAKKAPVLLEKITQNDLARYLGVTPVGLSRIKKRVQGGQIKGSFINNKLQRKS